MNWNLWWALPLFPMLGGGLTYLGLRRGWSFWVVLPASAAYARPVWFLVLVAAYLAGYRHPKLLAPFVTALLAALVVHTIVSLKLVTLQEQGQLRARGTFHYPFTFGMGFALFALLFVAWLENTLNDRLLAAFAILGLVLVFVFFLFERSQRKVRREE